MLGPGPGRRGRDHGRAGARAARPRLSASRRRVLVALGAWTAVIALRAWADRHPAAVERVYARGAYVAVSRALSTLTGWLPFSLAELGIASILIALALAARRAVRRRGWRSREGTWPKRAGAAFAGVAALAGLTVLVFDLLWGLNYDREPVASVLGYEVAPAPPEELEALTRALLGEAAALRATLPEDARGVLRLRDGRSGAVRRAPLGYETAGLGTLPVSRLAGHPKLVLGSPLMSYLGISGIFIPFTGEANVNGTLPDWEIPFTAAHELAHQHGFAREDEANYVGYRACRAHPDADFRYSGTFEAALYSLAALAPADAAAHARLRASLGRPLRRDLAALAAWRARYETRLGDVQDHINDAYLKTQGQREGIRSYGRMVDLLLAERRRTAPSGGGGGTVDRPRVP